MSSKSAKTSSGSEDHLQCKWEWGVNNSSALIYDGLPTGRREFRLLQIQPSQESDAPMIIQLFKKTLDEPPPYEALSYRWEGPASAHPIIVNGVKLSIMGNLYSALLQLRQQSFPSAPHLWIDSICINQNCIRDRNQQVELMGEIYTKARLLRVWIGLECENVDKAFDLIRDCTPASDKQTVVARITGDYVGTKTLTELLQRSYWSRMWMFQEIVLAKRAIVHCGGQQAPWANFRRLDEVSAEHQIWIEAQIKHRWVLDLRKALYRIAHLCIDRKQTHHINNVLHPTRHLQCQDPRDKLYALRGVCKPLATTIEPDYSVPVHTIFTDFAMREMIDDKSLSFLLTAGMWNESNGEDISLPSWVPDLRGMGGVDMRYIAGSYVKCFEANDHTDPRFYESTCEDGSRALNVHALFVDQVQLQAQLDTDARSEDMRRDLISTFCQGSKDGNILSLSKLCYFFQAMIFQDSTFFDHHRSDDLIAKKRMGRLVLGFFEELSRLFEKDPIHIEFLKSFRETGLDLLEWTPSGSGKLFNSTEMNENHEEYLCRAGESIDNQVSAIFSTVNGRIGIGPRNMEERDLVAIVQGCRVPLVLREYGNYYRLVGPAYVSGLMQKNGALIARGESGADIDFEEVQIV